MTRARLILGCLLFLAAAVPAASLAAPRMPVGFQDDPSFRWREDRLANLNSAAATGATIIRTTAYWSRVAPTRPENATDPFDAAYHFDDIDELVRSATFRGMTVLLTIWGTPGWANNNQGENHAPSSMSDLQAFSQALAARYSGRFPGFPHVGFYSLWNEPNLAQFLAPQYGPGGKPAAPAVYAAMAKAFIAGIKAGDAKAKVGIGETSPRGRQRPIGSTSTQDTIAPGLFAQLVAKAQPNLRFDAWAHHPYSGLGQGPMAKVAFPNVNLAQIPTFEKKLQQWFKRKFVHIWVTEYGFETKPGEPKGVTTGQQAAYAKQAMSIVAREPLHLHVHLVHLPRRPDQHVAERAREHRQHPQAGVRHVHCEGAHARLPQPDRLREGEVVESGRPRSRSGSCSAPIPSALCSAPP